MKKITNVFIHPEEILSQLDLHDSMEVADFGCGNGYFSIPLAKVVVNGNVYALDVIKETLEAVESQANLKGIENIKTIHCNLEILNNSKLENESMDLVLMRNILFQSQKKAEIIKEANRVLKPNGKLILLEWIPGSSMAPKKGELISKDEAIELMKAEEIELDKELILDNQHYGLIFEK